MKRGPAYNPETPIGAIAITPDGQPVRFGFGGWQPVSHYSEPTAWERTRAVLQRVKPRHDLPPFQRFAYALSLLRRG